MAMLLFSNTRYKTGCTRPSSSTPPRGLPRREKENHALPRMRPIRSVGCHYQGQGEHRRRESKAQQHRGGRNGQGNAGEHKAEAEDHKGDAGGDHSYGMLCGRETYGH